MARKVFIFLVIDQITKVIFTSRDFFFGPVKIRLTENYSLPFGIAASDTVSLVVVCTSLILLAAYWFIKRKHLSSKDSFGLALIFGGAISNVIDRFAFGYVRDYIDVSWGFVFNLADVFIVLGLILLFIPGKRR